jgi:hypothetical protein
MTVSWRARSRLEMYRLYGSSQKGGQDAFNAALVKAIDDLHALAGLADDPIDRQDVIKCLQALNGIQASEQKDTDAALGGKVAPRQMRKAYGQ